MYFTFCLEFVFLRPPNAPALDVRFAGALESGRSTVKFEKMVHFLLAGAPSGEGGHNILTNADHFVLLFA